MLGKNSMNIASLLAECRSSPGIEIAQELKILRPHVDAGKGFCQLRPLLSGDSCIVIAHRLDDP
jgi:hypothetical protein